jgi:heme/copper-type cytochrome/quinol oxidase subunit 2
MICLLVAGVIITLLAVITTIVVVRYKRNMGKSETNPGNIV